MEKGEVAIDKWLPAFSKQLDAFADPAYKANLEKTNFAFKKMVAEFTLFKEQIFKSGLGAMLKAIFDTARFALEAIGPIAKEVTNIISSGFMMASFPIAYMIGSISDLMFNMGLLKEESEGLFPDWVKKILSIVVTFGLLITQFKMGMWFLKAIAGILSLIMGRKKILSRMGDFLGDTFGKDKGGKPSTRGGNKRTGGKLKDVFDRVNNKTPPKTPSLFSRAMTSLKDILGKSKGLIFNGVKQFSGVLFGFLGSFAKMLTGFGFTSAIYSKKVGEGSDVSEAVVREQLKQAGITQEQIDAYMKTGPASTIPNKGVGEVVVKVEVVGGELSKVIKAHSDSEISDLLSNMGR